MNNITIELCTEDRARLDRLAEALEALRASQLQPIEPDPVQAALAETLAKATKAQESPENATGAAEAETLATTPQEEEKPEAEAPAPAVSEKKVTQADIRSLYVMLSASGKKEEAKAIILPHASKISDIPDELCPGVYAQLTALEG